MRIHSQRSKILKISLIFEMLVAVLFHCLADQTNLIKTNFVEDAKLDSAELKQVVKLAELSGINDVAEVETFHYQPFGARGIKVKSKERVDGRDISFDIVYLGKNEWGGPLPDKSARRLGDFYVLRAPMRPTLLRTYEVDQKTIRIMIGEGVDTAFADKVIPPILSKTVRFENDWARI